MPKQYVHHTARKRFGQNFLIDEFVINEIIHIINPKADDFIVEIGPGLAALTRPLLERIKKLHVVELDRDIISFLNKNFGENLVIYSGDALTFDYSFTDLLSAGQQIRIVGNLPYNISTPLLFHLSSFPHIIDMHFMLQKEIVERICAKPSCADYGRLSVMLQYKFSCQKMLDVSNISFNPQPQVESAIVWLKPIKHKMWANIDIVKLNRIVTAAFSKRRKTISNSLKNVVNMSILEQLGIDINKRAENISVDEYVKLANTI